MEQQRQKMRAMVSSLLWMLSIFSLFSYFPARALVLLMVSQCFPCRQTKTEH
jgi:hypothetical protein